MNNQPKLLVAIRGPDSLSDDDSSDEEYGDVGSERSGENNMDYFENRILRFNDQQFSVHFRITRESFEKIYALIGNAKSHSCIVPENPVINLEKETLITLWFMGNRERFKKIAERFGTSRSDCLKSVYKICKYLYNINAEKKMIDWPNEAGCKKTATFFENKTKFPGVIGCIDVIHIAITKPNDNPKSYKNKKGFYSVVMQAICNENLEFIDCHLGEKGSMHNTGVFRRSPFFRNISSGKIVIKDENHLLGGQGLRMKPYLLVPFKDGVNLNDAQRNYNEVHASIKVAIDRAFDLLTRRFKRLQKLQTRKSDLITLLIVSGCVLHNFCLRNGDHFEEIIALGDFGTHTSTEGTKADKKRDTIVSILQE